MALDAAIGAAIASAAIIAPAGQIGPLGAWRNPQGTVIVSIAPCGQAYCGVVQWASDSAIADARRGGTDPLIGTEVLSQLRPKEPGRWRGRLFVPDLNKRSKAELHLVDSNQLKVTVCGAIGLVCKSQVWTRVVQP